MAFRIEVYEGDTVDRVLELTDENGAAYNLTSKTVTLDIAASFNVDTPLLTKTTATAAQMEHDGAGGNVTVHFVTADWATLSANVYDATLRIDGDTVENGKLFVKEAVPPAA